VVESVVLGFQDTLATQITGGVLMPVPDNQRFDPKTQLRRPARTPENERTLPHRNRPAQPVEQPRSDGAADGAGATDAYYVHPYTGTWLEEARTALRNGERKQALDLAEQASELDPNNLEAWLWRAALAEDGRQRLSALSKAIALAPENTDARIGMYETLKHYLEQDPFLRYIEETDTLYQVLIGAGRMINVSKDRVAIPPYPPPEPLPLQPAYRWLTFAVLGLLIAGIGTVICAPIALSHAWQARKHPVERFDRRRATMAMIYAAVIWVVGLALAFIFVLHI
jgi:tetratricopeptide (TPR) repeat protein